MVKRKLKEITKLLLHVTSTTIFHIKFGKEKLALSAPFCLGCWCLGRTRLLKPHLGSILKHLSYLEMMKKRRLGDFCNLGLMIFPQSKAEKENRWGVSFPTSSIPHSKSNRSTSSTDPRELATMRVHSSQWLFS